ncbi:MAG: hypothetical protein PHQ47_00030 [Candidatus Portnoybacteria bacterium]|nr:hypothetical protein [Candidatus Portnoybacteria bacterium]
MPLTREQLDFFQYQANANIDSLLRKESLFLAMEMEPLILTQSGGSYDNLSEAKKLLFQLKWVGCGIIRDDNDFYDLVKYHLLEGFELNRRFEFDAFSDLVFSKLANLFGSGLQEMTQNILSATRENNQTIGANPIMVKNETRAVRPTVRHWLIDFLRSSSAENPGEVQETDYLFNNPNAKALSEEDKKTLGQVLAFYDTMRLLSKEVAMSETMPPSAAEERPLIAPLRQQTGDEFHFEERPRPSMSAFYETQQPSPRPIPPQQSFSNPARTFSPPPPPAPRPQPAWPPSPEKNSYQPRPASPPPSLPIQPPSTPSKPILSRITPPQTQPVTGPASFRPAPIPPPIPVRPNTPQQKSTYRETITPEDLDGPQTPRKTGPKLNGNVVNLKDFNRSN